MSLPLRCAIRKLKPSNCRKNRSRNERVIRFMYLTPTHSIDRKRGRKLNRRPSEVSGTTACGAHTNNDRMTVIRISMSVEQHLIDRGRDVERFNRPGATKCSALT